MAYINGKEILFSAKIGDVKLQKRNVIPSDSVQKITPSAGYDGLSEVIVDIVPTESSPTITTNGTHTVTSGKYWNKVTVDVPSPTITVANGVLSIV